MKEEANGWVVIAKNHPTNNRSWIVTTGLGASAKCGETTCRKAKQ